MPRQKFFSFFHPNNTATPFAAISTWLSESSCLFKINNDHTLSSAEIKVTNQDYLHFMFNPDLFGCYCDDQTLKPF